MTEPATATAIRSLDRDYRIEHAMRRLLHRLVPFMRAYPHNADEIPDHVMSWSAGVGDDNPHTVVAQSLQATPALWLVLLPTDVCIVPKAALATVTGNNPHIVEHLARMGVDIVESRAAMLRHDEEEKDRRKRYYGGDEP